MIALAEPLSAEQLQRRVLVKAPMGIEDSSRYWSAAMVLEHLIEVGSRIAVGIVELTHGSKVTVKADIADVKPKGGKGIQIVQDFRQFLGDYSRTVSEDIGDRNSKSQHAHPWFGRPNQDGIVRGWFDGKLVVEHTDVVLRSTDFPKMKFNQFLMAPYFGPGLLPHAQKLWIDELAVGTKRIGPLMAASPSFSHSGRSGGETKPANVKLQSAMLSKPCFGSRNGACHPCKTSHGRMGNRSGECSNGWITEGLTRVSSPAAVSDETNTMASNTRNGASKFLISVFPRRQCWVRGERTSRFAILSFLKVSLAARADSLPSPAPQPWRDHRGTAPSLSARS